jgi:hypothetical protein
MPKSEQCRKQLLCLLKLLFLSLKIEVLHFSETGKLLPDYTVLYPSCVAVLCDLKAEVNISGTVIAASKFQELVDQRYGL